jgi:3D (Asp-Asp-Asp) domain-containing protein
MNNKIKFFIISMTIACIFSAGFTWKLDRANKKLITTQNELNFLKKEFEIVGTELLKANVIITDLKSNEYEFVYLGEYKLTHYCTEKREHICGTGAGITATGTQVTSGRTIAVDPSVIPYGTEMYIEGYGWRIAEDCGGSVKGNHIDIAVEAHSQALSMGISYGGVWILIKRNY